jgi:hypothetical protein
MTSFMKGFCEGSAVFLALWGVFGFVMMNWDVTSWDVADRLALIFLGGIAWVMKIQWDRI